MIRLSVFLAFCLFCSDAPAQPRTDPSQYSARMSIEIQRYLVDCSRFPAFSGDLAACKNSSERFADEYYEAMEGNVADQVDMALFFDNQPLYYGVKSDPVEACAWFMVADDNGGSPGNFDQYARADARSCRTSSDSKSATEARRIEDEMLKVENLTY